LASVEAFGTGCSALTWDDPCASLRETICEIDMAAAGAGSRHHSRDCQNPRLDVAAYGRIWVMPPLTKRRADGWCPNCVREGNKKLAGIGVGCAKRLAGGSPRRAAISFGDNDTRYTEVRDEVVQRLLAAAGGIDRSCRCMSSLRGGPRAVKQLQRARRYAKMANLPPAVSEAPEGPRTFDTPKCTISSVSVGWWRSGAANRKTPVDISNSDMKPGVFPVPRAAGSLLKIV
jgi:hypothetical protein